MTLSERLESLAAFSEPDAARELSECAAMARDLLASVKRLQFAGMSRDNVMGDPSRLLDVQAELRAAVSEAFPVIAKAEGRA